MMMNRIAMPEWICTLCGHVYGELQLESEPFEYLSSGWRCPGCAAEPAMFSLSRCIIVDDSSESLDQNSFPAARQVAALGIRHRMEALRGAAEDSNGNAEHRARRNLADDWQAAFIKMSRRYDEMQTKLSELERERDYLKRKLQERGSFDRVRVDSHAII